MSRLRGCRRWGVTVRPRTISGARNSFSLYRCGRDIPLRSVTSELICDYESWLKRRSVTRNTVSFYMRILRSVYNKAVERGLVSPSTPFKYVYTGIEKTRKRAVDEGTVVRLQQLDLSGRHRSVLHVIFSCSVFIAGEWPLSIWPICVNPMSTAAY